MKIGLYSITYLGVWYRGKALTLEQVVRRARQYGYHGVEIDGKRPHGNPLDMPAKRCRELKRIAKGEGIELYAVAANNDFGSPVVEHRECQLLYLRELLRMTQDLGVKLVRIFAAWSGVTRHPQIGSYDIARRNWLELHRKCTPGETWAWCREGLSEASRLAREHGVILALQNHKPVVGLYRDLLRMVKEVNSPNLKVCLDAPLLRFEKDKSTAELYRAARAAGKKQVLSHYGGEFERDKQGRVRLVKGQKNMPDFIRAMREIGYRGYFGYELCHPLPVIKGKKVGLDFAHKNAKLAAEYLRTVMRET